MPNRSAVHFADTVRLKAVRCENACPDERIKEALIGWLQPAICDGVRMFCERKLEAHLKELAQYADVHLDQQQAQIKEPRELQERERSSE